MSTFGIEEEFFLLDRSTGLPATPTPEQTAALLGITAGGGTTATEWLTCQIETSSQILTDGTEALASLQGFRRALARTAEGFRMDAVALGTPPRIAPERATITPGDRYAQFAALAPGFAVDQYVNGMHVHVGISDRDTRVHALNGVRHWLPVFTALGANSPMWRGEDTGFASWRSIHYSRWMASGVPPHFRDADEYDERTAILLEADVVAHRGSLNWLARLPTHVPTIEVRACDVQMRADDTVALALLVRAVVDAAIARPVTADAIPAERFAIAQWQAARCGLDGRLFDPVRGASVTAGALVQDLLWHAQPFFADADEESFVRAGVQRLLDEGTGAARQREAYRTGGIDGPTRLAAATLTM